MKTALALLTTALFLGTLSAAVTQQEFEGNPRKLHNFVPSTASGLFDAELIPAPIGKMGKLKITTRFHVQVPVGQTVSAAEISSFEKGFKKAVETFWNNSATFHSQKAGWNYQVKPVFEVVAVPSAVDAHYIVHLHKNLVAAKVDNKNLINWYSFRPAGLHPPGVRAAQQASVPAELQPSAYFRLGNEIKDARTIETFRDFANEAEVLRIRTALDSLSVAATGQKVSRTDVRVSLPFAKGSPTPSGPVLAALKEFPLGPFPEGLPVPIHVISTAGAGEDSKLAINRAELVAAYLSSRTQAPTFKWSRSKASLPGNPTDDPRLGIHNPLHLVTASTKAGPGSVEIRVDATRVGDVWNVRGFTKNTYPTIGQITVTHEYGHMIGLPDQYYGLAVAGASIIKLNNLAKEAQIKFLTESARGAASGSPFDGTQANYIALTVEAGAPFWRFGHKTCDIMSVGTRVAPYHFATIWEALTTLTGDAIPSKDWVIRVP